MKDKLILSILLLIILSSCTNKEVLPTEYHNIEGKESRFEEIEMFFSFSSEPVKMKVELVDGLAIIEGDIIVGTTETLKQVNFAGVVGNGDLWDNSTIPYIIQNSHPKKQTILKAIDYINTNTNLSIIPKEENDKDYVFFAKSSGCSSWVGKRGGMQKINIGKCSFGSIVHEILHASGFFHEQSRTDRDEYVEINFSNIKRKSRHNFKRYIDRGYDGIDLGKYNYESIMHYSEKAFAKKKNRKTIIIKKPPATSSTIIGQRKKMSNGDIKAVNQIYK